MGKYAFPARAGEGFVSSEPSRLSLSVRTHHSRRGGGERRTTRERQFVKSNLRGNSEFLPAAQEVKWHCRTVLHHLKSPATTNERKGSGGGREGGAKEGRRFKFQIRYRIAEAQRGGGRESATFFAAALPNGLGGRAATALRQFKAKGGSGRIRNAEGEWRGGREGGRGTNK